MVGALVGAGVMLAVAGGRLIRRIHREAIHERASSNYVAGMRYVADERRARARARMT